MPKKLNKNAKDKVLTPEQTIVNSALTQAAATVEIAECLNDIAGSLDSILELGIRIAEKQGLIAPDEGDQLRPSEEPDDEPGE